MKQSVSDFVKSEIGPNMRVGVVQFSTSVIVDQNLDNNLVAADISDLVLGLEKLEGGTWTKKAME